VRRPGGQEVERHVLVDGNNLVHRAYYAYVEARYSRGEPLLSGPGGYPTGVIYGSLSMLSSWLWAISNPTRISVFFDGYSKRRKELDPSYKSNRDDAANRGLKLTDPSSTGIRFDKVLRDGYNATCEVDVLSHILSLLGCDIYHHPSEEADDLIASFCRRRPETLRFIVSADKDFFQLLTDPRVVCYVPGVEGDRFFDAEKSERYWARLNKGKHPAVPPSHVRMFKALCGDASDGISGVERLRKKVAVALCHHGSVDELYATGLPGFSPAEKEKALAMVDRVRTNYELVGLHDTVDLDECVRPGTADFTTALDIIRQDLDITSVDVTPFRIGETLAPAVPEAIPMDAWLSEI